MVIAATQFIAASQRKDKDSEIEKKYRPAIKSGSYIIIHAYIMC